jgi:valyl-tRNA synthetase
MKSLTYLLIIAFSCFTLSLNAQVREQTRSMSQGTESALVIKIPNTNEKLVAEVWQDYIKDAYKGKTKWNRKEKEWFTDNVSITAIGGVNTVDLYTAISKSGQDVELALWCDLGGAFLSSRDHRDRYDEAEKMLMRFSMEVAKAGVMAELDDQMKELKKLESDLKKLQNENERYHKDIEKAEEAIQKAKEGIVKNEKEQERAAEIIKKQNDIIENTKKRLKEF